MVAEEERTNLKGWLIEIGKHWTLKTRPHLRCCSRSALSACEMHASVHQSKAPRRQGDAARLCFIRFVSNASTDKTERNAC